MAMLTCRTAKMSHEVRQQVNALSSETEKQQIINFKRDTAVTRILANVISRASHFTMSNARNLTTTKARKFNNIL